MPTEIRVALGLTEFVSKLIEETFNAITLSAREQAERDLKFIEAVNLDIETFRDKFITDTEIDARLEELFPIDDSLHQHAIYENAPYIKGSAKKPEEPPIKQELGLTISKAMYSDGQLKASGVSAIRDTTKELLAQLAYNSFQQMVNRGIPRVVVEKGRIVAKLTFETLELEEEPQAETTPSSPVSVGSSPRFMFKKTSANLFTVTAANLQKLSTIRMAVTPADQGTDHSTEQRTKAYGEVEIHFKTISD